MSLIRFTNPLNFLGVPAISVPCGFTKEGLPVGLQLAGHWWAEETLCVQHTRTSRRLSGTSAGRHCRGSRLATRHSALGTRHR